MGQYIPMPIDPWYRTAPKEIRTQFGWQKTKTFMYDKERNRFYDIYGNRVHNILEFVTPNDLILFRNDPGYNIFPLRDVDEWLCELILEGDE